MKNSFIWAVVLTAVILAQAEEKSEAKDTGESKVATTEDQSYASRLQLALRAQVKAGKLKEFDWEGIRSLCNALCDLNDEEFVAALRPMAMDESVPAELRADALAEMLGGWGGSHDSEGGMPSKRQLAIVDQLIPIFPQAAQKAVVARGSLMRASSEFPDEAVKWFLAHPDLWQGSEREALLDDLLLGWGAFSAQELTLADVEKLGVKNYLLAGRVMVREFKTPQAIERMRKVTAQVKDQNQAAALRQGMLKGAGESLLQMQFTAAQKWLEEAGLSAPELLVMVEEVCLPYADDDELNHWIGWLAGKLPPEKLAAKLEDLGKNWQSNSRAIEKLRKISMPEARAAAVRGFSLGSKDSEQVKAAKALLGSDAPRMEK